MDYLRKKEISEGALRVEIDDPQNGCLKKSSGLIRGWLAVGAEELSDTLEFRIGGNAMSHRLVNRADVEAVLEEHTILGFEIPYDLSSYLPYIQNQRLTVWMSLSGYDPLRLCFRITEEALASCLALAGGV